MLKKIIVFILLVTVFVAIYKIQQKSQLLGKTPTNPEIFAGSGYIPVDAAKYDVSVVSSKLISPSRIKLTPDGKHLLITQVTGEVLAFDRTRNGWTKDPYQVVKVEPNVPGFPKEEAGLTGIAFSTTYAQTGNAFLLYNFKDKDEKIKNRISITGLKENSGKLTGSDPRLIFEANTPGNISHQITDGISVNIQDKPHLLFLIGEGFVGERAQDPKLEAGKLMLIQEDGSSPLGQRPYPNFPKIQALGIRNAYNIAADSFDKSGRFLIADTGPDKYDRIIFTKLFDPEGRALKPLNFNWNGKEESLAKPIPDPNIPNVPDMVLTRLTETLTFTGLVVKNGNEKEQTVLATVFGKTGAKEDTRGREIWKGRLITENKPALTFEPIVKRTPDANGKLGNPIGMEIDPQTNSFFFADILEGRLYQVKEK